MRVRTLLAITLTMFALPALAAETPTPQMLPPAAPGTATDANGSSDVSVVFEVRTIKVPVGFCERAGVKPTGNAVLGDDDLRRLLAAAQALPEASVMQFPKVTADEGQTVTVRNREERYFVTGVDATRVKGQTVLVPKNTPVELGDTLTLCGQVSRDAQTVAVKASLMRTRIAGSVELIPVVTQVTPVFEGGSQGKPVPFTQYIQSPDVRTEKVEKHVVISNGHTIVLGSWKETAEAPKEQPARGKLLPRKEKPAAECEVVAFATVRVLRAEEPAVAPMPREAGARAFPLRNVAAADAAHAVATYLKGTNLDVAITFDTATNTVFVRAEAAIQARIRTVLASLDKAPPQVTLQATVVKVPRGFALQSGLDIGNERANVWTLTPREAHMLAGLLRAEKERGGCEVLSRPQLCVNDGETGFVQVGGSVPVVEVGRETLRVAPTGFTLQVTPKVQAESGRLSLTVVGKFTSGVLPPAELTGIMFTDHTFRAGADLRDGQTLVIVSSASEGSRSFCGRLRGICGGDTHETLIILTPHITAPPDRAEPAGWFLK